MKRILIAIDDSKLAQKVATAGFEFGKEMNAEIALVSVVDTAFLMTDGGVTPKEFADQIKNDFRKKQQDLINEVFKDFKVWTFIEDGKPFEAILKIANDWKADVIVIGTHGRTGIMHALMGSVAEKVIRHSSKPIFIIPTKST